MRKIEEQENDSAVDAFIDIAITIDSVLGEDDDDEEDDELEEE